MTNEFQLFQNIRLILSDRPVIAGSDELMICCCVSGVCEYHIGNEYHYLTDDTILAFGNTSDYTALCSKDFRGAFFIITAGSDNADLSDLFDISKLMYDIWHKTTLIYLSDSRTKNLLSAIITGSEKLLISLMRLKTIELLMQLSERKTDRKISKKAFQTGEFICRNTSEHFTIPQLSEMFGINQTKLKSDFRSTFGCGIYSYIKKRKVFRSAELLLQTNMKIIDIAEEVGYSNASKFASAFQSVMSITPKHFRMEHKSSKNPSDRHQTAVMRY